MKIFILLTYGIFFASIAGTALAQTNSTSQSSLPEMFNPINAQYNIYNDSLHNFSLTPPDGWEMKSQSNGTNDALVTFSNQNPSHLANFGVYYDRQSPIPQEIFALPDKDVLNLSVDRLFNSSQFTVLQKNIERFSDGFIVQVVFEPKQNTQITPMSEWFLFWLIDGRQYFLIMTSSQSGFNQNAAEFERTAYSLYVGPQKAPSVPEFGPAAAVVFAATLSVTLFVRMKKFE